MVMGGAAAPPPSSPRPERGCCQAGGRGASSSPGAVGSPPWDPPNPMDSQGDELGAAGTAWCISMPITPPSSPGMSRGGQTERVSPRGAGARRNVFQERGVRRDRHKFYFEAFSLMAPIAWRSGTPASNSQPPASDSAAGGEPCSSKAIPMLPSLFPFLLGADFPPRPSPRGWASSQLPSSHKGAVGPRSRPQQALSRAGRRLQSPAAPGVASRSRPPALCRELERDQRFRSDGRQGQEEGSGSLI